MQLPQNQRELPEPKRWYRLVGPGAIMVATSLGSGEIYFWPHLSVNVGAWVLLIGVAAIGLQYVMNTEISRYTLATGETVVKGFDRLWRPLPWIIMACCTLPWIWPGWAMGGAVATTWLVGGEAKWFGVASLILAGVLLSLGRTLYRSLELTQLLLILGTIVVACFTFILARGYLAAPQILSSVSKDSLVELMDVDLLVILTALAFCGAGGTINLTQSNYIKEKRFGMGARVPRLLNPLASTKPNDGPDQGRTASGEPGKAGPRPSDSRPAREEGYVWEPSETNRQRWRRWWREARSEQFVSFFLIGSFGLLLLSLIAVRLVGGQEPQAKMALLKQEMTAASSLWPQAGTLFAVVVILVFFTSEIGVLDHVCRLVANIAACKGLVDPKSRWRAEGALYLYALWIMIGGGIFILLCLNVKDPPKLLVIAGSLSALAMAIYTVALLVLHRVANKRWHQRFPSAAVRLSPFAAPRWRTVVLVLACLLFGALSLLAIATHTASVITPPRGAPTDRPAKQQPKKGAAMSKPSFTKVVVGRVVNDDVPAGAMNTFSAVGDVNADGRPDIVIAGRNGRMVWLENTGQAGDWPQHLIDEVEHMECGGSVHDLTSSGWADVINGSDAGGNEIFWWENPGPVGGKWTRRVIARTEQRQFHDTLIGDVGDGRLSLVFTNQKGGTTIYRVPLPAHPTVSPWPDLEVIASGRSELRPDGTPQPEEGLAIGDVDGDGVNEVVCGTHWYKLTGGAWQGHKFARGYISTKAAVGDIDGDGNNEIVLSEGDPCIYGKPEGGKLAWFKPGRDVTGPWTEHVVKDLLLDAHSLRLADLCGSGRADIFVGEIGKADRETDEYVQRPPRLIVFENLGGGRFAEHVIDEGTGTHDAALADMCGRGVLDIVGKPLHGPEKWSVHVWTNVGVGSP